MISENRLILLGHSGSVLAMIFNALKVSGHRCDIVVLENMDRQDTLPWDCGLSHSCMPYTDYMPEPGDRYFMSLANVSAKQKLFSFFEQHAGVSREQFVNIVHPHSSVSEQVQMNQGIYMGPGAVTEAYSRLGFGVFINRGVTIGHHVEIGDFSTLNPGVHVAGNCRIGKGVGLGIGAVVFDHVSIGDGSIIGGGSVVTSDIPPGVVAYGNPCRVVRQIEQTA